MAGDPAVPRRVKDFIDISEYTSLEDLIRYLETIRDNLPPEHQAEMKIRGDEIFGRRLTITYFREQTPEETEIESKYSRNDEGDASIEDLRHKLDEVPYKRGKANGS
jgi:phage-related protein